MPNQDLTPALGSHESPQSLLGAYYAVPEVFANWLGADRADGLREKLESMVSPADIEFLKTPLPPFGTGALDPEDMP
jgi:hypothetical protein